MPAHERAMLAYVRLADLSRRKQQPLGADRFLVLAAASACRAGWPQVAERCRDLVLAGNPNHLVGRFETFPNAMRSREFQPFLRQLERFCGYERAEHMLRELNIDPGLPTSEDELNAGPWAVEVLSGPHWDGGTLD